MRRFGAARSDHAAAILERVRAEQPLIHLITNFVTMNRVADALRALGARPVLAFAREEVEEIAPSSRAVVLNLGTPTVERIAAMRAAGAVANGRAIPIVFDPVGVGASAFRTENATALLDALRVNVIRGNAGEIAALAGQRGTMSGVDFVRADYDLATLARAVAQRWRTVVAITGATDCVGDGTRAASIYNGHAYLETITGGGDIASALIGACLAVERDALVAASSALVFLGLAGEQAAERARGPASFHVALFDELHALDADVITRGAKMEWIQKA